MRETLRRKRIELGLTQAQVAIKAGITQQCYSHIEKGIRNPRFDILKKISKVLDISDINSF